ncbi:putative inner membrane ABC transporter ATP-binding protein yddA [Escherichia coli 1-182-04_S3_C2]|nr:putative inner membrane ABC transporter ATP-binding protein yddA [Escherichia coli 1-182-04_S3_C3]EZJ85868.1 putative inner membrane ABC transporter ATP-binding protein yddA [Escherichia coli 1-182-04_S3_C2]EZJ98899.1 putative inner membrane ABC transporter ATP-binding protein yddA [Escherichia coli 1-182-04_S3_C1]
MFAGKKSAQIREILISESAWEEMTCLFAPSLVKRENQIKFDCGLAQGR